MKLIFGDQLHVTVRKSGTDAVFKLYPYAASIDVYQGVAALFDTFNGDPGALHLELVGEDQVNRAQDRLLDELRAYNERLLSKTRVAYVPPVDYSHLDRMTPTEIAFVP